MPSQLKRARLAIALTALAMGLICAPRALAVDTFTLNNGSSFGLYGYFDNGEPACLSGPWFDPTYPEFSIYTFNPGDTGYVGMSVSPFADCNQADAMQDPDTFIADGSIMHGPSSFENQVGGWQFTAHDPVIGSATVSASTWPTGGYPTYVQYSCDNDDLSCTYFNASAGLTGSFVSSGAALHRGKAVIPVQLFTRNRLLRTQPVNVEVVLRRGGHVLGRGEKSFDARLPNTVRVPVDRALERRVARHGYATVQATLNLVDGKPATGDRATLAIEKARNLH